MEIYWNALDTFQKVLAIIAIPSSIALVVQFVAIIFGAGSKPSLPGVYKIKNIRFRSFVKWLMPMITLKGILGLLSIGAWTGVLAVNLGSGHFMAFILGLIAGFLSMYLIALAFRVKSTGDEIYSLSSMIGYKGVVSIEIPHSRSGHGKISVLIDDDNEEFEAMSDNVENLAVGEEIEIVERENDILIVRPLRRI